jgi:hypothetical protein
MAKHVAASHKQSQSQAVQLLELVHSDLVGPFEAQSAGVDRYILTAIDDFSGMAAIQPLKHKDQATTHLKAILNGWERAVNVEVKAVRTVRGTEYSALDVWCVFGQCSLPVMWLKYRG